MTYFFGRLNRSDNDEHKPTWLLKISEPKEAATDAATTLRIRADSSPPTSVSSSARFMFTREAVVVSRTKVFVSHDRSVGRGCGSGKVARRGRTGLSVVFFITAKSWVGFWVALALVTGQQSSSVCRGDRKSHSNRPKDRVRRVYLLNKMNFLEVRFKGDPGMGTFMEHRNMIRERFKHRLVVHDVL